MSEERSWENTLQGSDDKVGASLGPAHHPLLPLAVTFCVMLGGMLLCEWFLGSLQSAATPWKYGIIVVLFAALLASVVTHFVIRSRDALLRRVHSEGKALKKSQAELRNSCTALENRLKEQDGELARINDQLAEETHSRKALEEALHESEDKTQNILNSIEDGFFEVDLAGNFTSFNESLCRIIGYSRDELMGMNYRVYSRENADKVYAAFNKVFKTGESVKEFDWEIITKGGERRYVEASISLISNSGTEPRGFRGIVRDITERKATEEKIKEMLHAFGKIWTK